MLLDGNINVINIKSHYLNAEDEYLGYRNADWWETITQCDVVDCRTVADFIIDRPRPLLMSLYVVVAGEVTYKR